MTYFMPVLDGKHFVSATYYLEGDGLAFVSFSSCNSYLTVILRTRVEYELLADEARSAESVIAHIRRE
jgi:hypothetical protein